MQATPNRARPPFSTVNAFAYLIGVAAVLEFTTHYILKDVRIPLGAIVFLLAFIFAIAVTKKYREKLDRVKGWRAGQIGRDAMYYEEFSNGKWHRMNVDGEMILGGKAHHVIYFRSTKFPIWAKERQQEIIERIKSALPSPGYEYDEEAR